MGQGNMNLPALDQNCIFFSSSEIISFHTGKYMADLIYLHIGKLFKLLSHRKLLIKLERIGNTYENHKL